MSESKIPTKEEFLAKFSPIQFKCELEDMRINCIWSKSEKFEIIMLSGRAIPLPNFFESFYDFIITTRFYEDYPSLFDHITFYCDLGLGPTFTVYNLLMKRYYCFFYNIITNNWEYSSREIYEFCSTYLMYNEIEYLIQQDKSKEIRLQKLEAFVNNICQKNQIIDQLINTADEIYNNKVKTDDKK